MLVDGDPTYAGTRLDFERFAHRFATGGTVLFHDATVAGPRHEELAPLMHEIEAEPGFERGPDVGTFVQFVRR